MSTLEIRVGADDPRGLRSQPAHDLGNCGQLLAQVSLCETRYDLRHDQVFVWMHFLHVSMATDHVEPQGLRRPDRLAVAVCRHEKYRLISIEGHDLLDEFVFVDLLVVTVGPA